MYVCVEITQDSEFATSQLYLQMHAFTVRNRSFPLEMNPALVLLVSLCSHNPVALDKRRILCAQGLDLGDIVLGDVGGETWEDVYRHRRQPLVRLYILFATTMPCEKQDKARATKPTHCTYA